MAFHWKWISYYPGLVHADLMIGGFFLVVAAGFLMTAVPRFTQSKSANLLEKVIAAIPSVGIILCGLLGLTFMTHLMIFLLAFSLVFFGLRRILASQFKPSPSFALAGLGVFSTLTGSFLCLWGNSLPSSVNLLARLLLLYGLPYGAILGIGTQLLPRLMGTIKLGAAATPMSSTPADDKKRKHFFIYGAILLASFLIEAFLSLQGGRLIRAVLVTGVVITYWNILQKPGSKGVMPWCLWVSSWLFVIGSWPGALVSSFQLHGAHIFFIGSVSLMIFSVATRVTLAHGGHGLEAEGKSKTLLGVVLFLLIALTARLVAPFVSGYFNHLAYASLAWIVAALLWGSQFFPKIFRRNL